MLSLSVFTSPHKNRIARFHDYQPAFAQRPNAWLLCPFRIAYAPSSSMQIRLGEKMQLQGNSSVHGWAVPLILWPGLTRLRYLLSSSMFLRRLERAPLLLGPMHSSIFRWSRDYICARQLCNATTTTVAVAARVVTSGSWSGGSTHALIRWPAHFSLFSVSWYLGQASEARPTREAQLFDANHCLTRYEFYHFPSPWVDLDAALSVRLLGKADYQHVSINNAQPITRSHFLALLIPRVFSRTFSPSDHSIRPSMFTSSIPGRPIGWLDRWHDGHTFDRGCRARTYRSSTKVQGPR